MGRELALIDFVIAGAQKCGTRALRRFLQAHPQIGLSLPKHSETHYFDRKAPRDRSASYDGYHAMFSAEALGKVTGDVTPIYIYQTGCLERIRRYNPRMKIIVLLRDPVDRAYSQWVMEYQTKREHRAFLPALSHELFHYTRNGEHPVYSYVQRGLYGRQILRLYRHFPRDQCLILCNEDLRGDHAATMRRVYRFLGVDSVDPPKQDVVHSRSYDPLPDETRACLAPLFQNDIRLLERLTGLDCSRWPSSRDFAPGR